MTFPFSNSNLLFLSDKISSIFEYLHPCPIFEYCFQETHPQTSSLTGREPIPGVLPQDLQVSKENFTGIIETYRLCSPPSVTLATPSRMLVCVFPLNSSFHELTFTELPALLHCRANSNKKERERTPLPHSHAGLSTEPPFNFLVPLSGQFKTAKELTTLGLRSSHS